MITLFMTTLFAGTFLQDKPDFSNSMAEAEVVFANMNRSIDGILASRQLGGIQSEEDLRIVATFQLLEKRLNKDYTGRSIKWDVMIAKSVLDTENTGDIIVPSSIAGTRSKQISMGGNRLAEKHILRVRFDGSTPWAKGMTRGQFVTLTATIKSVDVTVDGVEVALTKTSLSKKITGDEPLKENFTQFAGKWRITYDNKYTHEYDITAIGALAFDIFYSPNGTPDTKKDEQRAHLTRKDGVVLVKFANGKVVERFSLVKDSLIVERFDPISLYPKAPNNKGIGSRVK